MKKIITAIFLMCAFFAQAQTWSKTEGQKVNLIRGLDSTSVTVQHKLDVDTIELSMGDTITRNYVSENKDTIIMAKNDTIILSQQANETQYYCAGAEDGITITNNGDGTVTVDTVTVWLYKNADFTGFVGRYVLSAETFTLTAQTTNYIIANYNNGSPVMQITTDVDLIDEGVVIPLFTVATDGINYRYLSWTGLHDGLPNKQHYKDVKVNRFQKESGLLLLDSVSNYFSVSDGGIWYGVKKLDYPYYSSYRDSVSQFYKLSGTWTREDLPTYNNLYYDDGNDRAELLPNRYAVSWVYKINSENDSTAMGILYGIGNYTLAEAEEATPPASRPYIIEDFGYLIAKIICKKNTTTATQITLYSGEVLISAGAAVAEHNDLQGIQGGTTDEYYHHTLNEWNTHLYEADSNVKYTTPYWGTQQGFITTETDPLFDTKFAAKTTDDLTEGSTNLYSQWKANGADIYYDDGSVGINTDNPIKDFAVHGKAVIGNDITENKVDLGSYPAGGRTLSIIDSIGAIRVWRTGGANFDPLIEFITNKGDEVYNIYDTDSVRRWDIGSGSIDAGSVNPPFFIRDRSGVTKIRMAFDSLGNVGVGVTEMVERFEVDGNIKGDTLYINGYPLYEIEATTASSLKLNGNTYSFTGGGFVETDPIYSGDSAKIVWFSDIVQLRDSVADNTSDIASNLILINSNAVNISANSDNIASNLVLIQANNSSITSNYNLIQDNADDIVSNLSLINSNALDITANTVLANSKLDYSDTIVSGGVGLATAYDLTQIGGGSKWVYTSLGGVPSVLSPLNTSVPVHISNQLYVGNGLFPSNITGYSGTGTTLAALELNPASQKDVTVGYFSGVPFPNLKANFKVNGNALMDSIEEATNISFNSLYAVPDFVEFSDTITDIATQYDLTQIPDTKVTSIAYSGATLQLQQTGLPSLTADIDTTTTIATQYDLTQIGGTSYWTASGDDIYNNNSGNVGVGTNNPLYILHVQGDNAVMALEATGSTRYATMKFMNNSGLTTGSITYGNPSASSFTNEFVIASRQTGIPIIFYQGGTASTNARVNCTASGDLSLCEVSGDVGIGTTSPTTGFKLDVNGATYARDGIRIDDSKKLFWYDNSKVWIYGSEVSSIDELTLYAEDKVTLSTSTKNIKLQSGILTPAAGDFDLDAPTGYSINMRANLEMQKGLKMNFQYKTGSYAITRNDLIIVNPSTATGGASYTLPTTAEAGDRYEIWNESASYVIKVSGDFRGAESQITLSTSANAAAQKWVVITYTGTHYEYRGIL